MTIFWAHVDAQGAIVSWGISYGDDVFLQPLADGCTAMVRPEKVNGYGEWRWADDVWQRLVDGQWVEEYEEEPE